MKKIWLNKKYVAFLATRWTGSVFTLLGLVGTFVSLSDFLNADYSLAKRVGISVCILVGVWLSFFIFCGIYVYKKRRLELLETNGGHRVYVQYGDVFDENQVLEPSKRRNVVIAVNRCFDTQIDDNLISSNSLHGIAMQRMYYSGRFDKDSLNKEIQKNLEEKNYAYETMTRTKKSSGNLKRYSVGTVAEIKNTDNCTYFFLGLTSMNENLKTTTTNEEYVLGLMKMLEFCNERSQGFPVVIPLIGGGLSRTKKSERDILEYLVKLIKMNKELINSDIHIVVRETGKNNIAITDL